MRIIEPGKPTSYKAPPKDRKKLPKRALTVALTIILVVVTGLLVKKRSSSPTDTNNANNQTNQAPISTETSAKTTLGGLSGEEIKQFLDNFAYPNVSEITDAPEITGNLAADERIRTIAEARGYKRRAIPNTSLVTVDGQLMQQKAVGSWQQLKAAAKKVGLPLTITSVFRGVEEQRDLFNERLSATGSTPAAVAAGRADASVTSVLTTTSIPGYSKHHTGFTVDFLCGGVGLDGFEQTVCHRWLTDNSYQNARQSGWLPSYPEGASAQGPEPEAWEYVWVGVDALD